MFTVQVRQVQMFPSAGKEENQNIDSIKTLTLTDGKTNV